MPVSCSSNDDCTPNNICNNNLCRPRCSVDNECAFNEKCLKGNCILTCRVDNDCFLGHICLKNMCIVGCHADEDCSSSESCRNNHCTNPCVENPCGPNAVCQVANHRASCSCGTNLVPNPSAKIGCVRSPAPPCNQNRECVSGNICIEESCRTICSADSGCLNNERCELSSGVCKPICRRDDDCGNGEICDGLVCAKGCRSDSGCASDRKCVDYKCVDMCQSPTACGTNAECHILNHQKLCTCPSSLIGNPLEYCRYDVRPCDSDKECMDRQSCYEGHCQLMCRT